MSLEKLCMAVEEGETEDSVKLANELLKGGSDPMEIIKALTETMNVVGDKFARLEIFLPEIMMSGEAMTAVVEILAPLLKEKGTGTSKGKIVLGTVKGDLHEIGKNIVKLMMESNLWEVKDVGNDADSVAFIKAAEEMGAQVIGASSLMSTTLPHQKEIIDILKEKGIRNKYKVVIGGAPTTEDWAQEIGADKYCPDAATATTLIEGLIK